MNDNKHDGQGSGKMSRGGVIVVLSLIALDMVLLLGPRIVSGVQNIGARRTAVRTCKQQILAICEDYGLSDASIDITYHNQEYIDRIDVTVTADSFSKLSPQKMYNIASKMDDVHGLKLTYVTTKLISEGKTYRISPYDDNTLQCDREDIYVAKKSSSSSSSTWHWEGTHTTSKPTAKPTPKPTPKKSYSSSSSSSSSKKTTSKTDPYDVYDYVHPDDFYYDHYDDFYDFEDAEDYYYEHN